MAEQNQTEVTGTATNQPQSMSEPKPTAQTTAAKQSPPLELDPDSIFKRASMGRRYRYDDPDLGTVWIKRLSASEVSTFWDSLDRNAENDVDDPYADAKLIRIAVVDSKGEQKFTAAQVPKIAAMANSVLRPLVNACLDLNAMTNRGVEEIRKNFVATPGDDSV